MDDTAQEMGVTTPPIPETAEQEKKVSNHSHARRRIAEREARKSQSVPPKEASIDPEDEAMIAKSLIGQNTEKLMGKVDELEDRLDAEEVSKDVSKFVDNHEHAKHIDKNAITAMALDPKYAGLELEDIVWLSLKEKLPDIYAKNAEENLHKIQKTSLPNISGSSDPMNIADMTPAEYAKNREKILASVRQK